MLGFRAVVAHGVSGVALGLLAIISPSLSHNSGATTNTGGNDGSVVVQQSTNSENPAGNNPGPANIGHGGPSDAAPTILQAGWGDKPQSINFKSLDSVHGIGSPSGGANYFKPWTPPPASINPSGQCYYIQYGLGLITPTGQGVAMTFANGVPGGDWIGNLNNSNNPNGSSTVVHHVHHSPVLGSLPTPTTPGGAGSISPTPLPSTLAMSLCGLAAVLGLAWYQSSRDSRSLAGASRPAERHRCQPMTISFTAAHFDALHFFSRLLLAQGANPCDLPAHNV